MNSYQETIQYLYNLQFSGIKLGLDNISALLEFWNHPQKRWPAIHIAGTNGKGSTAAFFYSILKKAGFRVGLYTSPHLVDFSERIRVNDRLIPWETIVAYTRDLKPQIESVKPTFFEATTAIAFRYFAEQQVDIAVVETGLGGRLDATNLVQPLLTVITPISIDHEQFLGKGVLSIAKEKAGIIKKSTPCVTNNTDPEILEILNEKCEEQHAELTVVDPAKAARVLNENIDGSRFDLVAPDLELPGLEISLAGEHQRQNAALAAIGIKKIRDFSISEQTLRDGLREATWAGRLQIVRRQPLTLLDVGHNPHGIRQIFHFLKRLFPGRRFHVILGLAKDKDYHTIVDILKGYVAEVAVIEHFSDRELPAAILAEELRNKDIKLEKYETVEDAYRNFPGRMKSNGVLIILGSHYLAGAFLQKIQIS